jgi:hypothetical protein
MPARRAGFSTLELLITMALLALLVSQILSVVGVQQENAAVHEDVLETQEDARLVADLILTDLRMAGFVMPRIVGVSSGDGGANGSDRLCVSDAATINLTSLAGVGDRFTGAKVTAPVGGGDSTLDIDVSGTAPGDFDVDEDGGSDFAVGGGIILSDGNRTHCARVTAMDTGTGSVAFTPATPATFALGTAFTRVAPAIVYEMSAGGLLRNNILFARQIEDVQVRFVVDGTVVDVLDGQDTNSIATVELSIIARADRDDLDSVPGQRPPVANRTAGPADTFRRRVLTNTIAPRNFL